MTPATLSAMREILGPYFSEARARALYRVVAESLRAPSDLSVRVENPTGSPMYVNGAVIPPFSWIDSDGNHGRTVTTSPPRT